MTAVLPLVCFLFLIAISCPSAAAQEVVAEGKAPTSDLLALLQLKDSFANAGGLSSWSANGSLPCKWTGVFCTNNVVIGLNLANLGLSGKIDIDALAPLKGLRAINFNNNSFSGPLPAALSRLGALKSIYLAGNKFSGSIPSDLFASMSHLKKLWLDHNDFSGPVPSSLANLAYLMELLLDDNAFEGAIPDFSSKALKTFNAANNKLSGPIPASLAHFDAAAFQGNTALCGAPLSSTPCSTTPPTTTTPASSEKESGSGKMAVILVIAALLLFALVSALLIIRQRQRDKESNTLGADVAEAEAVEAANPVPASSESSHKQKSVGSSHKPSGSSRSGSALAGGAGAGGSAGELVMVNEEKGVFGLADLMKASAEVLGNGGLGSTYKAVMASGLAVAVKRMREMNRVGKDAFEEQIRLLGRLRHPNVLTPLAFHYRKEEKLVASEYVPKGSLAFILHGDRGPDHRALDWPTRLKIIRGIARGMAYLHGELAALDVPHGNLKSGNVLLGPDFEPLLVDYGFLGLVAQSQASHVMFAYKSPETLQDRHVSPKSDVYCLGVVILEVLTGKFPSQYLNNTKGGTDVVQWTASAIAENREAELLDPEITGGDMASEPVMVRLLQLGAACADVDPDERPNMKEVVQFIEEITVGPFGPLPSLKNSHADVALSAPEPAPEGAGSGGTTGERLTGDNLPFHGAR
ncbi:pollen receptor-like kinase 3 [Phoenix dactylifera]|uniref:Pollen receptor-like kinase 3 n=1 Tax=Phoenix dactylifera TaxID=42345 RepID=A0A8B7CMT2_PHODC|nr:pollen receptor-like kinase 3 [Phoenix dactylifera]